MTRLTKTLREKMAKILLKHRFTEQGEALAMRSAELFDLVYADKYDAETRRNMGWIQKRHKSAFNNTTVLTANVKGMRIQLGKRYLGKDGVIFQAEVKPVPVFSAWSDYGYIDCEIAEALATFAADDRMFVEAITKARSEVMGVLGSFSTERSLAEGWPEIIPLVGHILTETVPGTSLPAVQIARLNEAFRIPAIDAQAHGAAQ